MMVAAERRNLAVELMARTSSAVIARPTQRPPWATDFTVKAEKLCPAIHDPQGNSVEDEASSR